MHKNELRHLADRLGLRLRHHLPMIFQTEAAECGLACLAMVAGWHRMNVDLFSLRRMTGLSSRGATLRTVMNAASASGLRSRALRLDLDNLTALRMPSILHWDMNHFVVLAKVRGSRVVIHDPAHGRRVIGMQELSLHFTGVALELWPSDEVPAAPQITPPTRLFALTGRVRGLGTTLLKLFCLSLLIESVGLLLPVGMQLVMDHVIPAHDISLLTLICCGLLLFVLFRTGMSMLRGWTSLVMSTLIDVQWKARLFNHLLALPLAWFEKRKLGDVQSRFTSLDVLRTTLTTNVVSSIMDSVMVIGLMTMMILYGGWLTWVVLGFTLTWSAFRFFTYGPYRQATEEQIVKSAIAGSHFMETLYGARTIKSLGLEERRSQRWINLNVESANATVRKTKLEMMFSGGNTLIATLEQIALLWLGAKQVIDGQLTIGMFVAFSTYRAQFADRAANLLNLALQLRMLSLHKERVADIALSAPELNQKMPSHILTPGEPATLSVQGISFQHDIHSPPLFDDLDVSVSAGECVAITGPSGKGKTTLMKIMAGLLQPTAGEVRVSDIDITKAGLNRYRKGIACVLQDDTLFSGSVADNITAFDHEPEDEFMILCAQRCNIHEDIMKMPMGYQSLISELGGSLSGGQKQRLLIARALYRRPSILFMDEATSHLDEDNEAQINACIRSLNITRIIVAHRPNTIATADRIITI